MAISQNHIWDTSWVRSERQSFLWKKQLNDGHLGEGTLSAQMGLIAEKKQLANVHKGYPISGG